MTKLLNHPQVKPLLSDEQFSVDGTLIEAWASQKSFRAKDGGDNEGDGADFRGQKRSNETHASTTDPESRLYRKAAGREARLATWVMSPWRTGAGLRWQGSSQRPMARRNGAPRKPC